MSIGVFIAIVFLVFIVGIIWYNIGWRQVYSIGYEKNASLLKFANESYKTLEDKYDALHLQSENFKSITKSIEAKHHEEANEYKNTIHAWENDFNSLRKQLEDTVNKLAEVSQKHSEAIGEIADLHDAIEELTEVNTNLADDLDDSNKENEKLRQEIQQSIDAESQGRKLVVQNVLGALIDVMPKEDVALILSRDFM